MEENKAALNGIATHLNCLKITPKTKIKIKKTADPKVIKSCEIKLIVSTVIMAAPPKKSSPK